MPTYTIGRWQFVADDNGNVTIRDNGTAKETVTPETFESRGTTLPSYVRSQSDNYRLLAARAIYLIQDRRLGQRTVERTP